MRILHVSSFAPPHLGGVETCAANLFQKLTKVGTQITWLFSDVPPQIPDKNTVRIKVWNGIENAFGIPVPIPTPLSIFKIWRAVKTSNLVHIHDVMYLNCFFATLFAKILRKPVLITLHIWRVPYENRLVRLIQLIGHSISGQFCLKTAKVIVSYNRIIFNQTMKYQNATNQLISNGVGDIFIESGYEISVEAQNQLRNHLRLPSEKKIVVFAGRFVEKKGLSRIRILAASLPDMLFLLCGKGSIDPMKWGLQNVSVLGQKSPGALKALFHACDIFILPSVGEGFPLAIQEAMACGLPCCIFRETWLAWGEREDFFIILEKDNLIDGIKAYFESPFTFSFRNQLSEYAKINWDWQRTITEYQKIYDGLLGSGLRCT